MMTRIKFSTKSLLISLTIICFAAASFKYWKFQRVSRVIEVHEGIVGGGKVAKEEESGQVYTFGIVRNQSAAVLCWLREIDAESDFTEDPDELRPESINLGERAELWGKPVKSPTFLLVSDGRTRVVPWSTEIGEYVRGGINSPLARDEFKARYMVDKFSRMHERTE